MSDRFPHIRDENTSDERISLRFMVDKERKKVVYAEVGKDFVDVLFSFLTLPLGTIARLAAKDSNIEAIKFGSISSLYQSVSDLDQQCLWNQTCKDMLLKPTNSMADYIQNLKLNIDDTGPLKPYFLRENENCIVQNRYCVSFNSNQSNENGFVMEALTFIVSDDLNVMPNDVGTSLYLLHKHGNHDIDAIDNETVNISKKEVLDILKLFLISKTPLTDFIFKREQSVVNLDPRNGWEFWIGDADKPSDEMVVKVLRRKSNAQILFVEAKEDFVDFVLSFLTFPLGGVLHVLEGFSFLSCFDNLYKCVTGLSADRCLLSEDFKDKLTSSLTRKYGIRNQILPRNNLGNANIYNYVDPKSPISGRFTRGPVTFMVTDNLVVTPMSSISIISYLERMNVPLNDVEERVVMIGRKEGLSILKASLTTTSALTNGLSLYIMEQLMNEQRSQSIHK